jgi:hypothetical protein
VRVGCTDAWGRLPFFDFIIAPAMYAAPVLNITPMEQ